MRNETIHSWPGTYEREHKSFEAIGADLVLYYLEDAVRDYGDHIKFVQSTPTTIPLPSGSVDAVFTIDTIEHLSKPKEILRG